jgi:hypothetical protein
MPERDEKLIQNFSYKPCGKSPLARWEAESKTDLKELEYE